MATARVESVPRPRDDHPVAALAWIVLVGLLVVVATMHWLPNLALLACSLTVVVAAWSLHVAIRRIHRGVVALDDAVSALALDSAADRNTVAAVLHHARSLTAADRAWLVAEVDGQPVSVGIDGSGLVALEPTDFDRTLLAGPPNDIGRRPRTSGSPSRHVLAAGVPVVDQTTVLVVGRDRRLTRFTSHHEQVLGRLAQHAGAALTQRQVRGHLEAESHRHQMAAARDPLTGLVNRQQFRTVVSDAVTDRAPSAVVLVSLGQFARINDDLGLQAGDQFLRETARRIVETMPSDAVAARLGSDEFAVLLPQTFPDTELEAFGDALHAAITSPVQVGSAGRRVGAHLGIAVSGVYGDDAGDLLRRADLAMRTAKDRGAPVEVYHHALADESADRLELLGELRHALSNGAVSLAYQPGVRLADGTPVTAEALLRWTTTDGRAVPAREIAQLAEDVWSPAELNEWMLRRALQDCRCWWDPTRPVPVSVRLSGRSIPGSHLESTIATALSEAGLPPESLRIEVTETGVIDELDRWTPPLRSLRSTGVTVAFGDFGIGSVALAPLVALPIDQVKIHESLIAELGRPDQSDRFVQSIVQLAAGLGLEVAAQDVETRRQSDRLRELGCHVEHGLLVARPMSAVLLAEWLDAAHQARTDTAPTAARRSLFVAPTAASG